MNGVALVVTVVSSLLLGHELALRAWKGDDDLPWSERMLYASLIGSSFWLASTWAVALLHVLDRPMLLARTAAMVVIAIALLAVRLRRAGIRRDVEIRPAAIACAVALLPLFVWVDFSLWRGLVIPPGSIDALAYHLPKAVHFVRAHGYDALRSVRFILSWRPGNYELLLADAMAMDGNDVTTEWISAFFYLAWILACVALAQRWWGRSALVSLTTALFAGGVPVALLHSADYKNDLMAAYFSTAALVALGRWMSRRDPRALVLAIAALTAAAGTKSPAALFAVFAVPFLAWPLLREKATIPRARLIRTAALSLLLSFLLLGGVAYLTRLRDRFTASVESTETSVHGGLDYGHYANLWKGPYILVVESFSPDPNRLAVPWAPRPWVWQRFELYYSELGIPFSLAAIAMPFAIVFLARRAGREAIAMSALAFVPFMVILPLDGIPIGRFLLGLPRFALTIVPLVFAWTVAPLAAWLEARFRAVAYALVAVAAGFFVWYGVNAARYDSFAPLDYVIWSSEHRDRRLPPLGHGRAAAVLDEIAGPRDSVAFDGGVSSMLHLVYGPTLERRVTLIPPGDAPPVIGADVQWVVIDRAWNLVWGNDQLRDLAEGQLIGHGQPTKQDLRVLQAMLADPRFRIQWWNPATMQAVFRRK